MSSAWPLRGQDANSVPCPGCWPLFHLIKTLPLTTDHTPATAHLYIPHYSKTQKVLPTFLFSFPIFFFNPLQSDFPPPVLLVATDTVDHSFLLRTLSLLGFLLDSSLAPPPLSHLFTLQCLRAHSLGRFSFLCPH